jgi:hypothetical protein
MVDVFISDGVLHLVLEFCPYDMERVIRDKTILLQNHHVKSYMQMLLRGIECCHKHFVLHRGIVAQFTHPMLVVCTACVHRFALCGRSQARQLAVRAGRSNETC